MRFPGVRADNDMYTYGFSFDPWNGSIIGNGQEIKNYLSQVTQKFNIKKHISIIGHFQIADVVGRNEPGTGEINYHTIFKHIDSLGYEGFIGAEYKPLKTTEEGLSWIKEYENIQVS